MSANYILTSKGNPGNLDAPKKLYAQAKSSGEPTLRKLSKEIAESSTTVSDTDVLAVLNDLTKCCAVICRTARLCVSVISVRFK